jgi:hypothetical protein
LDASIPSRNWSSGEGALRRRAGGAGGKGSISDHTDGDVGSNTLGWAGKSPSLTAPVRGRGRGHADNGLCGCDVFSWERPVEGRVEAEHTAILGNQPVPPLSPGRGPCRLPAGWRGFTTITHLRASNSPLLLVTGLARCSSPGAVLLNFVASELEAREIRWALPVQVRPFGFSAFRCH